MTHAAHTPSGNLDRSKRPVVKKFGVFVACMIGMAFVLANVHSIQRGYGIIPFGIMGFLFAALPLAAVVSVMVFPLALVGGGDCDIKRFWRCAALATFVATVLGIVIVFTVQPTADQMHILGASLITLAAAGIFPAQKLHIGWRKK